MNKYRLSDKVRLFHYEEDGIKHSVNLRQIVALRDFADVPAGSEGGWLDDESALSQAGTCWIYDPNSAVFAGARIEGNARLTGTCVVSHSAIIRDDVWIDSGTISFVGSTPPIPMINLEASTASAEIKVVVKDMDAFQELLLNRITGIRGVTGVHSSFVLRHVVDRTALPV